MSVQLFHTARTVLAGGVSSPVRAFGAVGGTPFYARHGRGAWLFDADERPMLDLVGGWGAAIVGHRHPQVHAAIAEAIDAGCSFGMPHERETALALEIRRRMPHLERLRFTCSGTEAVMSAVRLARAATGREQIFTFAGNYHGHADPLLAGTDQPGVPRALAGCKEVLPYNDLEALERACATHRKNLAAILVEPVAANMGLVPPAPFFLESLRRLCDQHGALLIFDEVVTGFRVAYGGAAQRYGIEPDLTTLGKIVGGGLPGGAVGGRATLLEQLAPQGKVFHAGTGAGNPVVMAAGLATLQLLDAAAYEQLEALGARLEAGLRAQLAARGQVATLRRVGSLFGLFFGVDAVANFADARRADTQAFSRFFHRLLAAGVHLPPSPFEAFFLSLAHGEREIDHILAATAAAFDQEFVTP